MAGNQDLNAKSDPKPFWSFGTPYPRFWTFRWQNTFPEFYLPNFQAVMDG